jgi:hypothetical protein
MSRTFRSSGALLVAGSLPPLLGEFELEFGS